jgi:hypothetical protein
MAAVCSDGPTAESARSVLLASRVAAVGIVTTESNLNRHLLMLLDQWCESRGFEVVEATGHIAKVVLGLTSAAAEAAQAYRGLPAQFPVAKGILGRSVLEFSVTAVWVRLQGEPALQSMHHESERQRRNLAKGILDGGFEASPELVEEARNVDAKELPALGPLKQTAKDFIKICEQLDTNPPLYPIYRMFSQYSHASLGIADRYTTSGAHWSDQHLDRPLRSSPFEWCI